MEILARFLLWILGRLRFPTVRKLGIILGGLVYRFAHSRRTIALSNLDLAYGGALSSAEKERIARASFVNLITMGLEFGWMTSNPIPEEHAMRMLNPEVLKWSSEEGKGIIILVPHMGNWEASATWFGEQGYTAYAVSRKQKQKWMTRIVREARRATGIREIDKKNALKPVLAALRRGEIVLMLIDQYARKDSVEVEFFGQPAMTAASVALLAARTGCNVQVGCCFRFPDGSFGSEFSDPIETVVTGDHERDLVANTQRYVAEIEKYVRQHPEDWMWMHRRWKKNKPPRKTKQTKTSR